MYRVYLGNPASEPTEEAPYTYKKVYDDALPDMAQLMDMTLSTSLHEVPTFEFKMLPTHPDYTEFLERASLILVFRNAPGDEEPTLLFRGRILSLKLNIWEETEVHCQGDLGFLNDTIQYPYNSKWYTPHHLASYKDLSKANKKEVDSKGWEMTPATVIQETLTQHNQSLYANAIDLVKHIQYGVVESLSNESFRTRFKITDYADSYSRLEGTLIERFGGFLQTRTEVTFTHDAADSIIVGHTYLDWLELKEYQNTEDQQAERRPPTLRFDRNLIDQNDSYDTTDTYNVLVFYGNESSNSKIPMLQTMKDDESIAKYGSIYHVESIDCGSDDTEETAQYFGDQVRQYFEQRTANFTFSRTIQAIDPALTRMNMDTWDFFMGEMVDAEIFTDTGIPFDTHTPIDYLVLTSITRHLQSPDEDEFTFEDFATANKRSVYGDGTLSSALGRTGSAKGSADDKLDDISLHYNSYRLEVDETLELIGRVIDLKAQELIELETEGDDGRIRLTSALIEQYATQITTVADEWDAFLDRMNWKLEEGDGYQSRLTKIQSTPGTYEVALQQIGYLVDPSTGEIALDANGKPMIDPDNDSAYINRIDSIGSRTHEFIGVIGIETYATDVSAEESLDGKPHKAGEIVYDQNGNVVQKGTVRYDADVIDPETGAVLHKKGEVKYSASGAPLVDPSKTGPTLYGDVLKTAIGTKEVYVQAGYKTDEDGNLIVEPILDPVTHEVIGYGPVEDVWHEGEVDAQGNIHHEGEPKNERSWKSQFLKQANVITANVQSWVEGQDYATKGELQVTDDKASLLVTATQDGYEINRAGIIATINGKGSSSTKILGDMVEIEGEALIGIINGAPATITTGEGESAPTTALVIKAEHLDLEGVLHAKSVQVTNQVSAYSLGSARLAADSAYLGNLYMPGYGATIDFSDSSLATSTVDYHAMNAFMGTVFKGRGVVNLYYLGYNLKGAPAPYTNNLNHSHELTFDDKTGVLTLGQPVMGSTETATFNVASSTWFKNQLEGAKTDAHNEIELISIDFRDGDQNLASLLTDYGYFIPVYYSLGYHDVDEEGTPLTIGTTQTLETLLQANTLIRGIAGGMAFATNQSDPSNNDLTAGSMVGLNWQEGAVRNFNSANDTALITVKAEIDTGIVNENNERIVITGQQAVQIKLADILSTERQTAAEQAAANVTVNQFPFRGFWGYGADGNADEEDGPLESACYAVYSEITKIKDTSVSLQAGNYTSNKLPVSLVEVGTSTPLARINVPIKLGAAQPTPPTYNKNGRYILPASVSVTINGTDYALTNETSTDPTYWTPVDAIQFGFGTCRNNIQLRADKTDLTLAPGTSVTVYPQAYASYASYVDSQTPDSSIKPVDIASKAITISAKPVAALTYTGQWKYGVGGEATIANSGAQYTVTDSNNNIIKSTQVQLRGRGSNDDLVPAGAMALIDYAANNTTILAQADYPKVTGNVNVTLTSEDANADVVGNIEKHVSLGYTDGLTQDMTVYINASEVYEAGRANPVGGVAEPMTIGSITYSPWNTDFPPSTQTITATTSDNNDSAQLFINPRLEYNGEDIYAYIMAGQTEIARVVGTITVTSASVVADQVTYDKRQEKASGTVTGTLSGTIGTSRFSKEFTLEEVNFDWAYSDGLNGKPYEPHDYEFVGRRGWSAEYPLDLYEIWHHGVQSMEVARFVYSENNDGPIFFYKNSTGTTRWGTLKCNTRVWLLDSTAVDNRYYVAYRDGYDNEWTGYIPTQFVHAEMKSTYGPGGGWDEEPAGSEKTMYIYAADGNPVSVYSSTSTSSEIGKLYPNTEVTRVSTSGTWTQIRVTSDGRTVKGYLQNGAVSLRDTDNSPSQSSRTGWVSAPQTVTVTGIVVQDVRHNGGIFDSPLDIKFADTLMHTMHPYTSTAANSMEYAAIATPGDPSDYLDMVNNSNGVKYYAWHNNSTNSEDVGHKVRLAVSYSNGNTETVWINIYSKASATYQYIS